MEKVPKPAEQESVERLTKVLLAVFLLWLFFKLISWLVPALRQTTAEGLILIVSTTIASFAVALMLVRYISPKKEALQHSPKNPHHEDILNNT